MPLRGIASTKWLALTLGTGILIMSQLYDLEDGLPLLIVGSLFIFVSSCFFGYSWWQKNRAMDLMRNGKLLHAEFTEVILNRSLVVNGRSPFRVVSQWHDSTSNNVFIFNSANLWFDPTKYVKDRTIPVYVDRNNSKRYHVDLSFLPKIAN